MLRVLVGAIIGSLTLTSTAALIPRETAGTLTITSDTVLTEDHVGDIRIAADGITLDCAGNRVIGSGEEAGILVQLHSRVTVRDCHVSGFSKGILIDRSSQILLEGNDSSENEWGFWIALSDHVEALENTATNNKENGYYLGSSTDSTLSANQSLGNGSNGFGLHDSDRNSLSGNLAEGNSLFGYHLDFSHENALSNDLARRNQIGFNIKNSRSAAP